MSILKHIGRLNLRQIERLGHMFYFGPLAYKPEIDDDLAKIGLVRIEKIDEDCTAVNVTPIYKEYRAAIGRRYNELAGIKRNW